MKRPDFFLVGAPKCGTSSLAVWLAAHPAIYLSPEKEPHFFGPDHGPPGVNSLKQYEALFEGAGPQHAAVGEASTRYLFSRLAAGAILDYNPAARFIVMLRNPLEMAPSLHHHYLFQGNEHVQDFAKAWTLQPERAAGRKVSPLCLDPRLLAYGPICRLGEQLERLYARVTRERILVLWLDDLRADAGREYRRTLRFLRVPDDGRNKFDPVNRAQSPRSTALRNALKTFSIAWRRLRLPRLRSGLLAPLYRANTRPDAVAPLSPALRAELRAYFRDDIARLAALTGRDLGHWLA